MLSTSTYHFSAFISFAQALCLVQHKTFIPESLKVEIACWPSVYYMCHIVRNVRGIC